MEGFISSGHREGRRWLEVSDARAGVVVSTLHLSPSSLDGGPVAQRAQQLPNCDVGQHGCQLQLRPVFICPKDVLPQESGRGAARGQVSSSKPTNPGARLEQGLLF